MQIFHAFRAIIRGLGGGVTRPLQHRAQRRRGGGGQQLGQKRRLVESTLALAGRMEWDRDDHVKGAAVQARVAQGFAKPGGNGIAEVALPGVFEFVHQFADQAAAAVGRDGAIEMQDAMLAVRATEGLRDRTGKWLRTFRAERRHDPGRAALALGAEIFRAPDIGRAADASRRIEKRREGVKRLRYRERRHNVTTS